MKRQYYMRFLSPDPGGQTGGNTLPPQNNGAPDPNEGNDPFNGIDPDLLEPTVRERITKLHQDAQNNQKLARQNQSEKDRLAYELQRLQQAPASKSAPEEKDPDADIEENMVTEFMKMGVPQAQAMQLAKVQMISFKATRPHLVNTVQNQFAPMASAVNQNQAATAFQEAAAELDVMQDQQVSEAVWTIVHTMAEQGQAIDKSIVENLAYIQHGKKQRAMQQQQPPVVPPMPGFRQTPPMPNFQTRMSHPGVINPGPGKKVLTSSNAETTAAVATVLALMKPKVPGKR